VIRFACPDCGRLHTVPLAEAGLETTCAGCGQRLRVPPPPRTQTVSAPAVPAQPTASLRTRVAFPNAAVSKSPEPITVAPGAIAALPPELVNHPRYRIVRELGRGGMGTVYEAVQILMDRPVAIKVLNPSVLAHPDALPRFQAEVKAAAKLDHPNIVRAHDADQVGPLHLLVMEFVEGMNLADLVEQKGPLPVAHACHYIRQAALGLQHAFEQGMTHRDIKPHNLMLTPRGVVKILDFGLARLRDGGPKPGGLTAIGSFMGTPDYVAPEQATDARAADIRSDLYGLGCTLYQLLAGRPPFEEDTAVKLVLAHIEKEPTPLQRIRPDVPTALVAVVDKLLAKSPDRRYQTPAELAQALVPFIMAGSEQTASVRPTVEGVRSQYRRTIIGGDTGSALRKPVSVRAKARQKTAVMRRDAAGAIERRARAGLRYGPIVAFGIGGVMALGLGVVLLAAFHVWPFVAQQKQSALKNPRAAQVPLAKRSGVPPVRDLGNARPRNNPPTIRPGIPNRGVPAASRPAVAGPPPWIQNSIGTWLVRIPGGLPYGQFEMGSAESEPRHQPEEGPQHMVRLSRSFYMAIYPCTQREYERVMGKNPSKFRDPDRPVERVLWGEAVSFCDKLSALPAERLAGRRYRLPTEAEWEYACRAGTSTPYPTGESLTIEQANYNVLAPLDGKPFVQIGPVGKTSKVGSYPPNPWGLYDMTGNVFQMCCDWYDPTYYRWSPVDDPQGPDTGTRRVARGGSWYTSRSTCRSAYRASAGPTYRDMIIGFRIVLEAQ